MIIWLRSQLMALDRMWSRAHCLSHRILHTLEAAANALQRLAQPGLDLVKLLRDQRETSQQIVQVVVDLRHPVRDHAHLALHVVHRVDRAVHVLLRLLLQPIQGHLTRRDLLVHDSNLTPHLAHFRLDLGAQVGQRAQVVLHNGLVQGVESAKESN